MKWAYVGFVTDNMTVLPLLITERLERALACRSSPVTRGSLFVAPLWLVFTGTKNVHCNTYGRLCVSGRLDNSYILTADWDLPLALAQGISFLRIRLVMRVLKINTV